MNRANKDQSTEDRVHDLVAELSNPGRGFGSLVMLVFEHGQTFPKVPRLKLFIAALEGQEDELCLRSTRGLRGLQKEEK